MSITGRRVIKLIFFFAALALLWAGATCVLKEKFYFKIKINSPETEIWKEFYGLEKNSLDVLFLGSSHVYNGINPVVFYEETGMRGFDLSSSNQDVYLSYVYLQEALKYQKPEYVIMDAAMFNRGVFAEQKYYEMSFDSMKLSKLKIDSIREWKHYVPQIRVQDRFVPLLAYHSRWEDLKSWDFSQKDLATAINGYIPTSKSIELKKNAYDEGDPLWDVPPLTRSYFEKLSNLCFENDINLILILIPDTTTRFGKTEAVKMLAWDYDLTCLDYNESERFDSLGLDVNRDFRDKGHLNSFGAEKFTKVLASDLQMYGGMFGKGDKERSDPHWKELSTEWQEARDTLYLQVQDDMHEYLRRLENSDYTVFVAISDEGCAYLDEELCLALRKLGFDADFENGYGKSFYGVSAKNKTCFEMSDSVLEASGRLDNGKYWEITSASLGAANEAGIDATAVIKIGGVDHSLNGRGMNIVVYDEEKKEVVDCVCFDTDEEGIPSKR